MTDSNITELTQADVLIVDNRLMISVDGVDAAIDLGDIEKLRSRLTDETLIDLLGDNND